LTFVRDTLAGLARGGIKADSGTVEYYQSSGVKVSCERDVPVEVDGEFWGRGDELEFAHSERKLRVLAPEERGVAWWEEVLKTLAPWTK
jgi:diacylglycerol kinase family enzyme